MFTKLGDPRKKPAIKLHYERCRIQTHSQSAYYLCCADFDHSISDLCHTSLPAILCIAKLGIYISRHVPDMRTRNQNDDLTTEESSYVCCIWLNNERNLEKEERKGPSLGNIGHSCSTDYKHPVCAVDMLVAPIKLGMWVVGGVDVCLWKYFESQNMLLLIASLATWCKRNYFLKLSKAQNIFLTAGLLLCKGWLCSSCDTLNYHFS